jgi:predicted AlkP superfamily pyrophosphatase or phosphodiesterase
MRADSYLGRLQRGLERRGLADKVNVVVVSDHGMASVSADRIIVIDNYLSPEDGEIVDLNPTLALYPKAGKEESVFRALERAHPRLKVYRRGEMPPQWHYNDHPRIPPIMGIADEGWQVLRRSTVDGLRNRRLRGAAGQHGYDPVNMSMRAMFVAAGPAFKTGVIVPPFRNVDIYNVLAQVLRLKPAPNDGDAEVARQLLR